MDEQFESRVTGCLADNMDENPTGTTTPTTGVQALTDQIKVVATARITLEKIYDLRLASHKKWKADNEELFKAEEGAAEYRSEAEDKLREMTLLAYTETGMKIPAPGVGIREVTKLAYAPHEAFLWAIEHTMALKLDTVAFAKIAKVSPPDFVEVTTEPQATIATNLDIIKEEK